MVELARAGFVAASISYRGTYRDDVVFPAAVQDMKEAVRFLRANADAYHIDVDRVGLLGDSSGGNTAAMAALADGAPFDIGENLDQSSAAKACCCVRAGGPDQPGTGSHRRGQAAASGGSAVSRRNAF